MMPTLKVEEAYILLEKANATMGRLRSCLPMEPRDGWTQICLADLYQWRSEFARATKDLGRKNVTE